MAWQPPASDAVSTGWQPPPSDAVDNNSAPPNATIEAIAQPIRDLGNAVAPYAQQVASQPDIQPFHGLNPFTKPQGGPVSQVLGSMRQVASLPFRFSQTLGQLSGPASDYTAEYLGRAGVNPYASAAAAMVAGAAVDPRSWVPTSGVSIEHPNELPEDVAKMREARTGVPARQFQALYKDPGALMAGRNVEEAGKNIGAAKVAAGIDPGVTNELSSLTPENVERINPTKAVKLDDINTVLGQISNNQTPSPQVAQNALDSVNSILSQPSVQNNRDVFRQWSAIKTHINDALGQAAPDVRAANAAYAREKLGAAFAPMAAVNKTGTPSKLALLAQQIPGAVGGVIGHQLFGDVGAVAGYKAGQMMNAAYHAPFIAGLQTAAGSVANSALGSVERGLTNPAIQAYLARFMQQQGQH